MKTDKGKWPITAQLQVAGEMIEFNATPWFESSSDALIASLFGAADIRADAYAEIVYSAMKHDPAIKDLFDKHGIGADVVCQIDPNDVRVWIGDYRPDFQASLPE